MKVAHLCMMVYCRIYLAYKCGDVTEKESTKHLLLHEERDKPHSLCHRI